MQVDAMQDVAHAALNHFNIFHPTFSLAIIEL